MSPYDAHEVCDVAKCPIMTECPLVQSFRKARFFPLQNALQSGRCKMVIFYQIFSKVAKCPKNAIFFRCKMSALQNGRCKMVPKIHHSFHNWGEYL